MLQMNCQELLNRNSSVKVLDTFIALESIDI